MAGIVIPNTLLISLRARASDGLPSLDFLVTVIVIS